MSTRQFFVPPEGPPQGINPSPKIYAIMGEDMIFKMLEDFYVELGNTSIRHLFPDNLIEASKRSAAFFVSILGGPPLYHQLYGPPMMRKRHMPFPIDEEARQVWVQTFFKILENADKKYNFPLQYMDDFKNFLDRFSGWMVNTK